MTEQLGKNQQGYRRIQDHELTGYNQHLSNTLPNDRTHVLFKCPQNIHQERPYPGS